MGLDAETVKIAFPQAVPMVATLNLEFVALDSSVAVMRLPDQTKFHNHVGGPHAGAMFTLAESASGAIVLANFGDKLDQLTPLAVESTIKYLKLAKGAVLATARMHRSAAEILAELDAGTRPEFTIEIDISTEDGTVTGQMTIAWTLVATRSSD